MSLNVDTIMSSVTFSNVNKDIETNDMITASRDMLLLLMPNMCLDIIVLSNRPPALGSSKSS